MTIIDTYTGEIIMTDIEQIELKTYEAIIERGLQTFYEVGQALMDIREKGLYKQFGTFEEYCRQRWGMSRQHAYHLIASSEVYENLSSLDDKPTNERQTRPLETLEPAQQVEAWQAAVASATNGKVTARHVEAAVAAIKQVDTQIERETAFDYKRDAKTNRAADEYVPQGFDACQTPPYALAPLLPYLKADWTIWEPACGSHMLVEALYDVGFSEQQVIGSDLLTGQNFFEYAPEKWDCLITNPPFSLKYKWLERCFNLGRPFALLLPVETLGAKTAQDLMKQYGFEIMLLDSRVDFQMPNKGFEGTAQFPVMWFCWQLLPQQIMFGSIQEGKRLFNLDDHG